MVKLTVKIVSMQDADKFNKLCRNLTVIWICRVVNIM